MGGSTLWILAGSGLLHLMTPLSKQQRNGALEAAKSLGTAFAAFARAAYARISKIKPPADNIGAYRVTNIFLRFVWATLYYRYARDLGPGCWSLLPPVQYTVYM